MTESSTASNFRSPVLAEPILMPPTVGAVGGDISISSNLGSDVILRTPAGNVRSLAPPPLPLAHTSHYSAGLNAYGYGGYNNSFGNYAGNYGSYGGFGGFGNYGGYGGGFGSYNRFGMTGGINPMDPETRFIQLAEAISRPAFESIESFVSAIGNIASMLDSTFFALKSSFRAVLGVAVNFSRLRGVFAQFWSTFAIFRGLSWIYKKILYWLRISNLDPSSECFKKAFDEAISETKYQTGSSKLEHKRQSPWPILTFLSFIITAPYLVMKLLSTVTNTAQEEACNPSKWVQPIESVALYDFQARNISELTIRTGQRVIIAPKEIQNTLGLLNTGWVMATTNGQTTGIIPINYVKSPQQMRQEQVSKPSIDLQSKNSPAHVDITQPSSMNISTSTFAAPPSKSQIKQSIPDLDIAPQPVGPPIIENVAMQQNIV